MTDTSFFCFSFEMIASFVPTKHRRLIIHIRKTNDRYKRKKREKWEETIAKVRKKHNNTTLPTITNRPGM